MRKYKYLARTVINDAHLWWTLLDSVVELDTAGFSGLNMSNDISLLYNRSCMEVDVVCRHLHNIMKYTT